MQELFHKNKIHIIFLSLLSLNYFIPFIIFGKITLFYHDTLDSEIVYNSILGKIFAGEPESIGAFLNNEIKPFYLRRLFQPITVLYYLFSPETAYWIIDILVKLVSYFSFYILAKKITLKKIESSIVACLFACMNVRSQDGLGIAITPYLIYLLVHKDSFGIKNYFIICLAGFNADLVTFVPQLPAILFAAYFIKKKENIKFLKNLFAILIVFFLSILISNLNLIYIQFSEEIFHRENFFRDSFTLIQNFKIFLQEIFFLPEYNNWTLFYKLPYLISIILILFVCILQSNKVLAKILLLIFLVNLIPFIFRTNFITNLRNNSDGIFNTFQFEYIVWSMPILFLILLSLLLKDSKKYKKILKFTSIMSILLFQINSSVIPFGKKFIIKEENYRNIYTFEEYYMYNDYKKIKKFVKNDRVISVGYDPMIAVMNDMNVIDGYHNIYPVRYKIRFRKIIEKELAKNSQTRNYYDNWGSRVYAFVEDPKNIELNFSEAKKIGANYIISKYFIDKNNINLVSNDFNNRIYLYKILK